MIIAVCNEKGGVGKTTLATNLAEHLTQAGPVLLVDADPQGNATTHLGIDLAPDELTLNDVLAAVAGSMVTADAIRQAIKRASHPWTLSVLAADRHLASREADIALGRESRLKTVLDLVGSDFAHIVIDCPPAIGMLTTNALVAADRALIVTTPRETAFNGVSEMVTTIATVRTHYNRNLTLAGIVLNAHKPDRRDPRQWASALRTHYGSILIEPALPDRERISSAGTRHEPISHGPDTDPTFAAILATVATHDASLASNASLASTEVER